MSTTRRFSSGPRDLCLYALSLPFLTLPLDLDLDLGNKVVDPQPDTAICICIHTSASTPGGNLSHNGAEELWTGPGLAELPAHNRVCARWLHRRLTNSDEPTRTLGSGSPCLAASGRTGRRIPCTSPQSTAHAGREPYARACITRPLCYKYVATGPYISCIVQVTVCSRQGPCSRVA